MSLYIVWTYINIACLVLFCAFFFLPFPIVYWDFVNSDSVQDCFGGTNPLVSLALYETVKERHESNLNIRLYLTQFRKGMTLSGISEPIWNIGKARVYLVYPTYFQTVWRHSYMSTIRPYLSLFWRNKFSTILRHYLRQFRKGMGPSRISDPILDCFGVTSTF